MLVEAAAGFGQVEDASGPAQELHAQPLLERRDAAAHGRLRHAESFGRGREATGFNDRHKGL